MSNGWGAIACEAMRPDLSQSGDIALRKAMFGDQAEA